MIKKRDWEKLQEFQNEHQDLLIMFACPLEDAISISFAGLNTFVKFPATDMSKGVVFNALRASTFVEGIEPFMEGLVKAGFDPEKDKGINELMKTLGGGIKAISEAKAEAEAEAEAEGRSKLEAINNKPQWPKRKSKKNLPKRKRK